MVAIQEFGDALRSRAASASGHKAVIQVLEDVLENMMQLDSGMLSGQIIPLEAAREAGRVLGGIANEIFGKLCETNPDAATDWLDEIPMYLKPSGIDFATWRDRLKVPSDSKLQRRNQDINRLVAEAGGDGEQLTVEMVERAFKVVLPGELRTLWQKALRGGENRERLLICSLRELLGIAQFVTDEQTQLELIPDVVAGQPFPVLPIADGLQDSDYFVLELADRAEAADLRVLLCCHDATELGEVYGSFSEWIVNSRFRR